MAGMFKNRLANGSLAWQNQVLLSKSTPMNKAIKKQTLKNLGLLILINLLIIVCFLIAYTQL